MSRFYIMVEDHRLAVASADTKDEIMKNFNELSQYKGYRDKMIILERCDDMEVGNYPWPNLDNIIDEEETHS